jgi:hypothetical protein
MLDEYHFVVLTTGVECFRFAELRWSCKLKDIFIEFKGQMHIYWHGVMSFTKSNMFMFICQCNMLFIAVYSCA